MHTKVLKGEEARRAILEGARVLFEAVKSTYGPDSANVGILRGFAGLKVTHDGATVADSIELKGAARAGAEVIKNSAKKMDKKLGDGTSTVTILAFSIIEAVQDALILGESPIKIRKQIQKEAEVVLSHLDALVKKDVTLDVLKSVAGISAGDKELGAKIAEIVYEVGAGGTVIVEESTKNEDSTEVTSGYTIDNGVASNYMIRDTETMSTTLVSPYVLVANKKIDGLETLLPIIKAKLDGPVLVIANDFSEVVVSVVSQYNLEGKTNIIFVKSPRFGEKRLEFLKDIASVVGTKVVDGEVGFDTSLGQAGRVVATKDSTTIYDGAGQTKDRIEELQKRVESQTDDFEKTELQQRIAQIEGKAATIYIGGYSQDEVAEKKYRADDAVFAAKAALRGGVVAGGATTPLDLAEFLPDSSILKKVLAQPADILLKNVDLAPADFKLGNGQGVDVTTGKQVDLFKEGIVEPAETIETAIKSAVSIAGTAITMSVLVVEEEDEDE